MGAEHQHREIQGGVTDLADHLRRRSRKVTVPRQAVLRLLEERRSPLTIKEIQAGIKSVSCDLATIYRSVHLLEEMGLVKRFDFGDGTARYEYLQDGDDGHHHHLICTSCAAVVEIEDCFPPDLQNRIAEKNGFKVVTHRLEFFGVCPGCQR
jgi:Fur family ferric uptake transcriptional regulator